MTISQGSNPLPFGYYACNYILPAETLKNISEENLIGNFPSSTFNRSDRNG
jgi:hypothetical protein